MSRRVIDRRYHRTQLLFANDTGSVERDRREETRREAARFKVHLWMEIAYGGERELVFAPEISTIGTFIVRDKPLELGSQITLTFSLPRDPVDIVVLGRVASIRTTGPSLDLFSGNGIAFTQVSDEAKAQIQRYTRWIEETKNVPMVDIPG